MQTGKVLNNKNSNDFFNLQIATGSSIKDVHMRGGGWSPSMRTKQDKGGWGVALMQTSAKIFIYRCWIRFIVLQFISTQVGSGLEIGGVGGIWKML